MAEVVSNGHKQMTVLLNVNTFLFQVTPNLTPAATPVLPNLSSPPTPNTAPSGPTMVESGPVAYDEAAEDEEEEEVEEPCVSALQLLGGNGEGTCNADHTHITVPKHPHTTNTHKHKDSHKHRSES